MTNSKSNREHKAHKNGRPLLSKDEKRTIAIKVYINSFEETKLEEMLNGSIHRAKSDMMRYIIFNNELKKITIDPLLQAEKNVLIEQTKRIGNNFSQLVRLIHSKKRDYFTHDEVNSMLEHLRSIDNQLSLIIKNDNSNKNR